MTFKKISMVVLVIFLLVGCSNENRALTTTVPTLATGDQLMAYPSPVLSNSESYPSPANPAIRPGQPVPAPISDAPQPKPGMASISGTLYSFTIDMVLPETLFYLTPGGGADHKNPPPAFIGPEESKGDIVLTTDADGNIRADNIPPGNYYLAVMAPLNWAAAINSEKDASIRLFELKADESYPLGIIYVSWP